MMSDSTRGWVSLLAPWVLAALCVAVHFGVVQGDVKANRVRSEQNSHQADKDRSRFEKELGAIRKTQGSHYRKLHKIDKTTAVILEKVLKLESN